MTPDRTFTALPDPGQAGTLDELVETLRALRTWAGEPSYAVIAGRINTAWKAAGRPDSEQTTKSTVVDCFKLGRRRLNTELVLAAVRALHPESGYVAQWRQALRVIGGEIRAASQVRVQDTLPAGLATFTGRRAELDLLRHRQPGREAVVISAIDGMAGVGKTELAVHAAHQLMREHEFERVLFVNLRGFHPDTAQPPADPAAVLDGFLRLLGVPGQQIPHGLQARVTAFRDRVAGMRVLIVLDNAANGEQVRPLLPAAPGCLTLVTSRRGLADLRPAIHLTVEVFTEQEALAFLARAVPEVPVGTDPSAPQRIAERCGYLPLALGLVAGHIRGTPGWTLTDHADRLDERERDRRLESGVELALDLSYQHLPADRQRLMRLAALHPGQDFDDHAAAALTDADLPSTRARLSQLCHEHLLHQNTIGRYGMHDLVRAYAIGLAGDHDPPSQRHEALSRLFAYYANAAATAMEAAHPSERHRPPAVAADVGTPDLTDRKDADQWLDLELANLLATAQHAAEHRRPDHLWHLSATLDRHLRARGRHQEAETLHQQALDLAREFGNRQAEVSALTGLGYLYRMMGRHEHAEEHYRRALPAAQDIGDRGGELDALTGLGTVHRVSGRYDQASEHYERALQVAVEIGDVGGQRAVLNGLGVVAWMLGHYEQAAGHFGRVLEVARGVGDRVGELNALIGLGDVSRLLGRFEQAGQHYDDAWRIARDVGVRGGELNALAGLGAVHRMLGHHDEAVGYYGQAWQIARETGDRTGELQALHGLGEVHRMMGRHKQSLDSHQQELSIAEEIDSGNWQFEALQALGRLHHADGHHELALTHHERALRLATDLAQASDQARAHDGLAHAHRVLGRLDLARRHWEHALNVLIGLGTDHTEEAEANVPAIRAHLEALTFMQGTAGGGGGG